MRWGPCSGFVPSPSHPLPGPSPDPFLQHHRRLSCRDPGLRVGWAGLGPCGGLSRSFSLQTPSLPKNPNNEKWVDLPTQITARYAILKIFYRYHSHYPALINETPRKLGRENYAMPKL